MRSGHAGPVTMGRITRGPPCWTRSQDETTSSQVFVRRRVGRRVSLPVVLPPLVQRGRRRHRAKGGVFAFAPTLPWAKAWSISDMRRWLPRCHSLPESVATEVRLGYVVTFCGCFCLLDPVCVWRWGLASGSQICYDRGCG
jgi:hypothetical protein